MGTREGITGIGSEMNTHADEARSELISTLAGPYHSVAESARTFAEVIRRLRSEADLVGTLKNTADRDCRSS